MMPDRSIPSPPREPAEEDEPGSGTQPSLHAPSEAHRKGLMTGEGMPQLVNEASSP